MTVTNKVDRDPKDRKYTYFRDRRIGRRINDFTPHNNFEELKDEYYDRQHRRDASTPMEVETNSNSAPMEIEATSSTAPVASSSSAPIASSSSAPMQVDASSSSAYIEEKIKKFARRNWTEPNSNKKFISDGLFHNSFFEGENPLGPPEDFKRENNQTLTSAKKHKEGEQEPEQVPPEPPEQSREVVQPELHASPSSPSSFVMSPNSSTGTLTDYSDSEAKDFQASPNTSTATLDSTPETPTINNINNSTIPDSPPRRNYASQPTPAQTPRKPLPTYRSSADRSYASSSAYGDKNTPQQVNLPPAQFDDYVGDNSDNNTNNALTPPDSSDEEFEIVLPPSTNTTTNTNPFVSTNTNNTPVTNAAQLNNNTTMNNQPTQSSSPDGEERSGAPTDQASASNIEGTVNLNTTYEPNIAIVHDDLKNKSVHVNTKPYLLKACGIENGGVEPLYTNRPGIGKVKAVRAIIHHPLSNKSSKIVKYVSNHGYGKVHSQNLWLYITPEQFAEKVNEGAYAYRVKRLGVRLINTNPHTTTERSDTLSKLCDTTIKKPNVTFLETNQFYSGEPYWMKEKVTSTHRFDQVDNSLYVQTQEDINPELQCRVLKYGDKFVKTKPYDAYNHGTMILDDSEAGNPENIGHKLYFDDHGTNNQGDDVGGDIQLNSYRQAFAKEYYTHDVGQTIPKRSDYALVDKPYKPLHRRGCATIQTAGTTNPNEIMLFPRENGAQREPQQYGDDPYKPNATPDPDTDQEGVHTYDQFIPYYDMTKGSPFKYAAPTVMGDSLDYTHVWQNPSENFLIIEDPNMDLNLYQEKIKYEGETRKDSLNLNYNDKVKKWYPNKFIDTIQERETRDELKEFVTNKIDDQFLLPIVENSLWEHYVPYNEKNLDPQEKNAEGKLFTDSSENVGYWKKAKDYKLPTILARVMSYNSRQQREQLLSSEHNIFKQDNLTTTDMECEIQHFAEIEWRFKTVPKGVNRLVNPSARYGNIPEICYQFDDFKSEFTFKKMEFTPKKDEVYPYSFVYKDKSNYDEESNSLVASTRVHRPIKVYEHGIRVPTLVNPVVAHNNVAALPVTVKDKTKVATSKYRWDVISKEDVLPVNGLDELTSEQPKEKPKTKRFKKS